MFKKFINVTSAMTALWLLMPMAASAHVIVTPAQVGISATQTFSISVPNERNSDVTSLKLTIPAGVGEVTPTVKAGWQIQTEKSGDTVTAIDWTAGTIPVGLRDDFTFRAQVPGKATSLDWKAYQTYADGTSVSWDQPPTKDEADDDAATKGPFSVTKVVDDLQAKSATTENNDDTVALTIALLALVISIMSVQRAKNLAKKK